ncbi:MAG: hypothetical protein E6583_07505 [Clostridium sp.]|uniref:hypothetical protein n=1 Tax=Clostridium celatum TaxID=36834 RepID=UPI001F27D5CE|nr:hypothetical protein [Clostridium celatum]MCE9654666.1 hypothetical protein [Clostridium celatum]MDU2266144.1 hypothetical protein [Clostridium celatum]MDU6341169.1 hypothetical protein [Clostridium sp.]
MEITIYFVGGTSITINKCDDKVISNVSTWLEDDNLKIFKIYTHEQEKTTLIRKDLILFIDIS